MKIRFSPIRSDANLTLVRAGDVLVVNGEAYDLSGIPEGATLPREAVAGDWLASDVRRLGGQLVLTLRLPIPAEAPTAARFPEPITVETDGPITLPTEVTE